MGRAWQRPEGEGRVALAGGQIAGLGWYRGFWNMALRVLHVLATGAATCDVVAAMWKLSSVYPAQPSSVPLRKYCTASERSELSVKSVFKEKHTALLCVYTSVCYCRLLSFGVWYRTKKDFFLYIYNMRWLCFLTLKSTSDPHWDKKCYAVFPTNVSSTFTFTILTVI